MDGDGTCEYSQVKGSKKWLTLAALTCNRQLKLANFLKFHRWSEQVCQGGQKGQSALSGPTDWILRYMKTTVHLLHLQGCHRVGHRLVYELYQISLYDCSVL